jgi:antitoxin component of MazEF toxin-antitoxin module
MKTRTLYKSGGSIVCSMPSSILDEVGLDRGDDVAVRVTDGSIEIYPIEVQRAHRAGGDDDT